MAAAVTGAARVVVAAARFTDTAADWLAEAIRDAAADRDVSIALAGGSTPRLVYQALAERPGLPWPRVRVFFGDERAVPPGDPASNYGMAWESLLSRVPVAAGRVFRMEADRPDLPAAAGDYETLLPARLDVLILGVGRDGHTASIFPNSATLGETERDVVPALAPEPPRQRLTITPRVIERARVTIVLAAGADKAAAVRKALEGPFEPAACPAQLVREGLWVLDDEAAGALG